MILYILLIIISSIIIISYIKKYPNKEITPISKIILLICIFLFTIGIAFIVRQYI
jgi:hypothetical protein